MSFVNKTFQLKGVGRVRLIHDERERERVWLIALDSPSALPEPKSWSEFSELLRTGGATPIDDPFLDSTIPALPVPGGVTAMRPLQDSLLRPAERSTRDRLWDAISGIVRRQPEIFHARYRGSLLRELEEQGQGTYPTLLKALRRYWQRGMTKAALIPDFGNCGGPGKPRTPGRKKLGRPRTVTPGVGLNVTAEHVALMMRFWKRSYLRLGRASLRGAYDSFRDAFLKKQDPGAAPGDLADYCARFEEVEIPTFAQFQYHFFKHFTAIEVVWNRRGSRHFESNLRPILSNARNEVRGIGYRYLIDATVADVHIVSSIDRNRIVGRPTVYLITDVATRVIVGFYVGLEPPSWEAALQALRNVFEDKVALCARYGLTIPPEAWPNAPSCIFLLADNAEMASKAVDHLVGVLFEGIESARAYRGDDKGVVERQFGSVQSSFGPFTPGYVEKPHLERGERDPRLDAAYTLEAFRKAVILAIVASNNDVRREFDGDPAVIAAGTPYIPTELWAYYEEQRLVDGKPLTQAFANRHLRHVHEAKLGRRAIRFEEGLYYISDEILAEPWFLPMLNRKEKLVVGYDPSDMTTIDVWSPVDRTRTFRCHLTPHSRRFKGCALSEVRAIRRRERENVFDAKFDPALVCSFVAGEQETLKREQLVARRAEHDSTISNAARTKDIRVNRYTEKRLDQLVRSGRVVPGEAHRVDATAPAASAHPDDTRERQLSALRAKLTKRTDDDA